jgi:hypothetical protein
MSNIKSAAKRVAKATRSIAIIHDTEREYALRAGNAAHDLVDDYLKRSGGLERGFAWQRHEERLWREIRKALRQAFRDGKQVGKAVKKP